MNNLSLRDEAIRFLQQLPEDASPQELSEAFRTLFSDLEPIEDDADMAELIRQRIEDLDSGRVKGIPAEKVVSR